MSAESETRGHGGFSVWVTKIVAAKISDVGPDAAILSDMTVHYALDRRRLTMRFRFKKRMSSRSRTILVVRGDCSSILLVFAGRLDEAHSQLAPLRIHSDAP